jgi:hypothetical protein
VNVTRTRTLAIGLLLILAVTLSACGGSSKDPTPSGAVWDDAIWDDATWQ